MKIAIFPGSFDPFTNGHANIVDRGLKLFDKVVIAIGHNTVKKRMFDVSSISNKIKKLYKDQNVEVVIYNELTVELCKKHNAEYILRGLRNTTDFEYENTIYNVNRDTGKIETVFMITDPSVAYISSTIVRELCKFDGDVSKYVPFSLTDDML